MKGVMTFLLCLWVFQAHPQSAPDDSRLIGRFVATTPCDAEVRPINKIPSAEKCDEISWSLELYVDGSSGMPTTFVLENEFRYYVDNRTNKTMGANKGIKGKWTILKGTKSDPDAQVYKLTTPHDSISFCRLDDNLLHVITADKALMVGTSGQNYTLTKTTQ